MSVHPREKLSQTFSKSRVLVHKLKTVGKKRRTWNKLVGTQSS